MLCKFYIPSIMNNENLVFLPKISFVNMMKLKKSMLFERLCKLVELTGLTRTLSTQGGWDLCRVSMGTQEWQHTARLASTCNRKKETQV